jgi:hypothetical protein
MRDRDRFARHLCDCSRVTGRQLRSMYLVVRDEASQLEALQARARITSAP